MKFKKILKITFLVLLFLAVSAYLLYAFLGMESTNPEEECVGVGVIIDEPDDVLVDSMTVIEILKEKGIEIEGKKMKDINVQLIKSTLEKNPFVISADCYSSNNGMEVGQAKLFIKLTQTIPVLLVFSDSTYYYVDNQAKIIKTDNLYPKNVLVANGDISKNYLYELVKLGNYIKHDEFWDNQIEQVFVSMNRMKEREITLIPRVGNHKILLGTIDKYDKKLKRLKTFYEKGLGKIGWNKYSILNLKYDNQVVGVIRGQEIVIAEKPDEPENNEANQQETNPQENNVKPNGENTQQQGGQEQKKEEPQKQEPPKQDPQKQEPPKQEPQKQDPPKQNPPKQDPSKQDPPKQTPAPKQQPKN